MSDRDCNFCIVEQIRKRVEKRGAVLTLEPSPKTTNTQWYEVQVKEKTGQISKKGPWFPGIPLKCGC